jgi:hypothetical protein
MQKEKYVGKDPANEVFSVGYLTTLSVSRANEDKENGKKVKINLIRKQSRLMIPHNSGQHCPPRKSTGQNSRVGLVRCQLYILFLRPVPILECSW